MIAWEAAAGPTVLRWPGSLLPCDHGLLRAIALTLQRERKVGAPQRDVAWTSAVQWIGQDCHSAKIAATRRLGNAQTTTRCGEPMQVRLWVRVFAQNHTGQRAIAGPRDFNGLCDDERVPLICPTCQVSAQSVHADDRPLLCTGLFSIFLVGGHGDAAWQQGILPEATC